MDKISIQRLEKLHPKIREEALFLYEKAYLVLKGSAKPRVTQGFRTFKEQDALYYKGRVDKTSKIVTNAKGGQSIHNYGLAFDFCLLINNKDVSWDIKKDYSGNGKADWIEFVNIFKENGWSWGGDWKKFTDYPHLQFDFGFSWQVLKSRVDNGFIRPDGYVSLDKENIKPYEKIVSLSLNLRKGPSISYGIIAVMAKGEKVEVLKELDKWSYIKYGKYLGYASKKYLI